MLISESILKKIIASKVKNKYQISEGPEERAYRKRMRKAKREELKSAGSQEEKQEIRKKYKQKAKEFRVSDKFEAGDKGETFDELLNLETDDQTYVNVANHLKDLMPEINNIEKKYKGLKLIKVLKSKKEQKFTIGQLKRFIKMGLIATRDGDYMEAKDKFCAAGVFLESPKTPDMQPINISKKLIDGIYKLCSEFETFQSGGKKTQKGSGKKEGGKTSNKQCVMDIQETLNNLNAPTPEVEQLAVDGRWGPKTSKAWYAACKANLTIGMTLNGAKVTEEIIGNILRDWPSAAPKINYGADPCGARDFVNELLKLRQEQPEPEPDGSWAERRKPQTMSADILYDDLLDKGISIDYLYTVEEFQQHYSTTQGFEYIATSHPEGEDIGSILGQTDEVERKYPASEMSDFDFSTSLYYDETKEKLLIDHPTGDGIYNDIILKGDRIYHKAPEGVEYKQASDIKNMVGIDETIITNGEDMLLNERTLRKFIRQKLISEALNAQETETLITTVINHLNDMAKDTDNFDAEQINAKMKAGQTAMLKKDFAEAKKQFNAVAAIADASSAKIDSAKKAEIKAVFTALSNMAGSDDPAAGEKAKDAVVKLTQASEKKKSGGGKGNSKVKTIQELLNKINKDDPKIATDGKWGNNTQKAYEKALDSNVAKLEELSKEKFALADIKKKWPELAKILSATKTKFEGNIDGIINLLKYLSEDSGEDSGPSLKGLKSVSTKVITQKGKKIDMNKIPANIVKFMESRAKTFSVFYKNPREFSDLKAFEDAYSKTGNPEYVIKDGKYAATDADFYFDIDPANDKLGFISIDGSSGRNYRVGNYTYVKEGEEFFYVPVTGDVPKGKPVPKKKEVPKQANKAKVNLAQADAKMM